MNQTAIQNATIKLIDGMFLPHEAEEIIRDVIMRKINFHNLKAIGSDEKFGVRDEKSIKRISELQDELNNLEEIIEFADSDGKKLKINATIHISFE